MVFDIPLMAIREQSGDPRRTRILEGALKVFLAYGFARVTMDDIAKAAELSRPALYLVFRNKSEIYRAIANCLLQTCIAQTAQLLSGEGSLLTRLERMIDEVFHSMMHEIETSPHGVDLLDMHNSLAGDIIAEWRSRMTDLLEAAIVSDMAGHDAGASARGFTPREAAGTFFDAVEGMRLRLRDPICHPDAAKAVARVVVAALRP